MKISRITAKDFMSFSRIDMDLNADTTVVTGPNAVGKSNLGRIIDVARLAVSSHAGPDHRNRLDLYSRGPRHGARRFRLTMDITMDQPWEKELIATFVRAVYASTCDELPASPPGPRISADRRDEDARERLDQESVNFLLRGSLVVTYDEGAQQRWTADWHHSANLDPHEEPAWIMGMRNGGPVIRSMAQISEIGGRVINLAEAWRRAFPDDQIGERGAPKLDFMKILGQVHQGISLTTSTQNSGGPLLDSVRDLHMLLGWNTDEAHRRQVNFVHVLDTILQRGIVLTDNRRLPLQRSFEVETVGRRNDLEDGSQVPAELYRLKNGSLQLRRRFERIQDRFRELVGEKFEVQSAPDPSVPGNLLIDVTVPEGDYEHPISFAGAGRQEALFLCTILAGEPGRVVILDEPGVHIEPTLQRRLAQAPGNDTQRVVITHSPDLVPVAAPGDLAQIVRLAPSARGSKAHRVGQLDPKAQARWLQFLGPRDARALLFSAGAVLCEGPTEVSTMGTWWEGASNPPSSSNVTLIDVNGHDSFGRYIEFLNAFSIPWAVIADGPALQPGSGLHRQMKELGELSEYEPDSEHPDFGEWKSYWREHGVFSMADVFGTDGSHAGELEAYFEKLDAELFREVNKGRSKPRVAAAFASRYPMPDEIANLYDLVLRRLELRL